MDINSVIQKAECVLSEYEYLAEAFRCRLAGEQAKLNRMADFVESLDEQAAELRQEIDEVKGSLSPDLVKLAERLFLGRRF